MIASLVFIILYLTAAGLIFSVSIRARSKTFMLIMDIVDSHGHPEGVAILLACAAWHSWLCLFPLPQLLPPL